AEEELAGDLPVRPPDRDQARDLELAPREAVAGVGGGGAAAEPLLERLAEAVELRGGALGQRPGAEPTRDPLRLLEAQAGGFAVAGRRVGDAGAQRDPPALVGDLQPAVELERARQLRGGGVGLALGQGELAERVSERGQRIRMAAARSDLRQRLGRGAG